MLRAVLVFDPDQSPDNRLRYQFPMDTDKTILDELHQVYLFEELDETQLAQIVRTTQSVHLPAKSILFEAGQPADRFYLVHLGQIKLFSLSMDGDEKVMEILYPGNTFAEAIMFMQAKRYPVSAQALMDSELYSFDMKGFRQILEESQQTCFRLMAGMTRRLHAKINEINNLTLHNATYRLVVFLLEQLPKDALELAEIHLSTPKSVIASRLSIQPETFSRILTRLSARGLIQVNGNDITLLDVQGLRDLL
jgi:CRP-like cAMP-binding protein